MLALPLRGSTPELYHGKYIAGMFGSGEQGVWYDPSDLSTLFQDAAGTIPVTAVGQPVGLMLDKSKNGVGTNGAKRVNLLTMTEQFDNSAWVKYSSTISGNAAVDPLGRSAADKLIESNTNNIHYIHRSGFSVSSGQTYIFSCLAKAAERNKIFLGSYDGSVGWGVSFNLANGTISGNRIGSGQSLVSSSSIDSLGNGWYRCAIKFTTTNTGISNYWAQIGLINTDGDFSSLNYLGDGTSGVYIWGADLRLASEASTLPTYQRIDADWPSTFPGNHATQSTTASRPTLSARVNLLTKAEQFDDAAWVAARATITANNTTAPNGTLTADRITETTDSGTHRVFQPVSFQPNTTYTASVCFKKGTRRWGWVTLQTDSTPATQIAQFFDLDTGLLGSNNTGVGGTQASRVSAAMTSLDNGWYRCSLTVAFSSVVTSGSFTGVYIGLSNADNVNSYNGSTSDYNWIWGTDLRAANDALNQPAYQRVNTATDYDTTGFKPYLRFDGVDDYLVTGSIDFTATDKMTVLVGVMAITPSFLIICELSNVVNSNNGSFYISCYTSGSYAAGSKGTILEDAVSAKIYPYPTTNTITLVGDISGDRSILRVNGSQVSKNTGDQGTGNYGNYPLYIGRRGGTTFPFNGRLYGLIVRGAQTDDAHLTHAEKYLAYKSGVTL